MTLEARSGRRPRRLPTPLSSPSPGWPAPAGGAPRGAEANPAHPPGHSLAGHAHGQQEQPYVLRAQRGDGRASPKRRPRGKPHHVAAQSQVPLPRYLVYPADAAFCVPAALFRTAGVAAMVRRVRVVADAATASICTTGHAFDGFAVFGCETHALERLFVIDPYTAMLLEWRLDQVEYPEAPAFAGAPFGPGVAP